MKSATIKISCEGNFFSRNLYRSNIAKTLKEYGFRDLADVQDAGVLKSVFNYGVNSFYNVDRKNSEHTIKGRKIDIVANYYASLDEIKNLQKILGDVRGVYGLEVSVSVEDFQKP